MADLLTLISRLQKDISSNLRVSMPAKIVSYDFTSQKADVKLDMKELYSDGSELDYPIVSGVPVVFMNSGGASITAPVKEGDTCLVIFNDRDITNWLLGSAGQKPNSRRLHDINDPIAIMGLKPFTAISPAENNDDLLISYDGSKIKLKPNGNIDIIAGSTINVETQNITINCTNSVVNAKDKIELNCQDALVKASEFAKIECKNAEIKAAAEVLIECENSITKATNNFTVESKYNYIIAEEDSIVICNNANITANGEITLNANLDLTLNANKGVKIKAKEDITIDAEGDIVIESEQDITIVAKNATTISAEQDLTINATGNKLTIDCDIAAITATTSVEIKAPTITHTGDVVITGALTTQGGITNTGGTLTSSGITFESHSHTYIDTIEGVPTPSVTGGPS